MLEFLHVGLGDIVIAAVALLAGVLLSTTIKDKIKGVPSGLRSALSVAETDARSALSAAQTKVVSDVSNMFKSSTATVKAAAATAPTPLTPPTPTPPPAA